MDSVDFSQEIWKVVPGYENYEVSSMGRVKRVKPAMGTQVGRILACCPDTHGRPGVRLDRQCFQVHVVVALAFLGPRPPKHEINHKNGKPTDNRIENLEYCTPSENQKHAYRTGLRKPVDFHGEQCYQAKLTEANVVEIFSLRGVFDTKELAMRFGVSRASISDIHKGRTWKYLKLVNNEQSRAGEETDRVRLAEMAD